MAEAVYITILEDLVSFDAAKELQALTKLDAEQVRVTLKNGNTYILKGTQDLYSKLLHAMNHGVKQLETR